MKVPKGIWAVIVLLLVSMCGVSWGTEYYVKTTGSDIANGLSWGTAFETIQHAIDTSSNGDVIEVNEGTYSENVNFDGKAITVRSTNPDNWEVVEATIIDAYDSDEATVTFETDEDENSVLCGFTITDGNSGILCDGTSPYISNCLITDNHVEDVEIGGGAHIYDGSPVITKCIISYNTAEIGGGAYIYDGSPTITKCIISYNTAERGGGIFNDGWEGADCRTTITDCNFSNNAADEGGAISNDGTEGGYCAPTITNCEFTDNICTWAGGAILSSADGEVWGYCNPEITNCVFNRNSVIDGDESEGGGAVCTWYSDALIKNCSFEDNNGVNYGGAILTFSEIEDYNTSIVNCVFNDNYANQGGAVCNSVQYGEFYIPPIRNSVFNNNYAWYDGGAVYTYCDTDGYLESIITNCTFVDNYAYNKGGAVAYWTSDYAEDTDCSMTNCILWNNEAGTSGDNIYNLQNTNITVSYSDIEGGYTGSGNINADPCFVNLNDPDGADDIFGTSDDGLCLLPSSPCLNAGNNNAVTEDEDIKGDTRISNGTVDMGAYELSEYLFSVLDSSGDGVAVFDGSGNLYLKGDLDESTTHTAGANDEFRVQDSGSDDILIIDTTDGNLYLDGQVYENQGTLTPDGTNNFIIEDSSGNPVAYIDDPNGDLYLKGTLYEQAF